jgi:AraC-like DNA-binding protein
MGRALDRWVGRTGRLQAARAFIENNIEWAGLSATNTAQALGISVRQLHLLFKPTGTTFSRYVLARRLEKARTALAEDRRRKIIEVAYSCGIESLSVFYRGFRDAYGMTPTEFRNSMLNTPANSAPSSGAIQPSAEAADAC